MDAAKNFVFNAKKRNDVEVTKVNGRIVLNKPVVGLKIEVLKVMAKNKKEALQLVKKQYPNYYQFRLQTI